ncbi:DUF4258 domain-containing protein [Candidatus Flexifilum breve]|uniref:DUF4258 domain-containing protein n=1 Tax=Candidatus Flexifilum breve TaxID=3140694 RepID=UPI0031CCC002
MNIVFSKHARERMLERQISEELVIWTVLTPDRTYFEDDGDTKFIRRMDGGNIHVVCKPLPEEEKWLVKSVWFRPSMIAVNDHATRAQLPAHSRRSQG